ncbi:ABC transporter ATP-binding protein/permease [Oxalobacter vibrioformis]|uniref:ABC transporter ATP-binding protein/permease n=1 Tax=Oxalobacter vibrioformis TaxID=933080 RepID=A0A9E9P1Q8_9BURK|nr:ABC transporter ATP-binding protein [Oxalobacter vibrioformis]WAW09102.1 ABC transporter ATP-binding protein/permease [Oxalobacter vibrioformis]
MKHKAVDTVSLVWGLLPVKSRRQAKLLVVMMAVATILETIGLGMIIPFLGSLVASNSSEIASGGMLGNLNVFFAQFSLGEITLGLLVLFTFKNIYLAIQTYFQSKFIFTLEAHLSIRLLRLYLEKPYSFFLNHNSAQLIRNIIGEVGSFCHYAVAPLCILISEILIGVGILCVLIAVNPLGAILMVGLLGFIGYLFHARVRRLILKWGEERQYHEGMRQQKLQECFGVLKEIKIAGLQKQFSAAYAKHAHGSCNAGKRNQTLQSVPRLFLEVMAVFVLVLVVLFAGATETASVIPIIGLYAAAAFRLMPSANRIMNGLQAIRYSYPSITLLSELFASGNSSDVQAIRRPLPFRQNICLSNVDFCYADSQKPVLRSVNLQINKGEIICISGPSGAGKSTLIDILCGLLPPSSGTVLVDGIGIDDNEESWQKYISYVPQTIFLVDGTIKENITLGEEEALIDSERLRDVVRICGLEEMVNSHPENLDIDVGERGAKISGGQKQRIGLARAIYRAKEVLVLDEATNALDAHIENEVISNIGQLKDKMTVIWITHGTTPLKYADKLITVKNNTTSMQEIKREK